MSSPSLEAALMTRQLPFDHVLVLVSLIWLCGLTFVPALHAQEEVFWATAVLLLCNFLASLWTFVKNRQVLLLTNCAQLLLFGVLSYQLAQVFGAEHYRFEREPYFYDWAEFTLAHLLRATDLLDALDEYGVHLQAIHHASGSAGLILVCLHVSADLFVLSLVGRWLWQLWKRGTHTRETSLQRGRRGCAVLMLSILILGTYTLYALMQEWEAVDWLLWPLDNVLRLLDIGDVMQVYRLRLHDVDMDGWTSAYALAFRFAAGLCLAQLMPWVRLWGFNGHWYTREELIDFLRADQPAFRAGAARALGGLGANAAPAVAKLRRALAHDFDLTVRCRAAEALGRIGSAAAPAVEDLAQALWHPHRPLRLRAARALGRIGPAARGALHDLCYFGRNLRDDRRMSRIVRKAVGKIEPGAVALAVPRLAAAVGDAAPRRTS
jgi:hypothetical protein